MAATLAGSVSLLLMRWLDPARAGLVWPALGAALGIGALVAWLRQRRRFETPETARVRLEDALGMHARLSSAAAGVGAWPPAVENLAWPLRWRWERPLAITVFAAAILA